jgi:Ca2+-binding EF-hand superfamily protein
MATHNNYRRTKANWERPSLNLRQQRERSPDQPYKTKSPWDQDSRELEDEFEQQLNALDVNVSRPWDEGSYEMEMKQKQREEAKKYKFHSLFEVPDLSDAKKRQLAAYEYNPPFNCGFNSVDVPMKSAKKLNADLKNPKTRKPWTYGELPADPVPIKQFPRPQTVLWDVPKGDQAAGQPLDSSGDPVLDELRQQLKSKGALGISGLARKFRIMDDDGSGNLNYQEFRKGIKECGLTTLTEKQIKHLFLYFDQDDSGTISYDEFLVGVRGVMNERRKEMVKLAFKVLDSDRSGMIDINDIKGVYNAKFHPDVVAEKRTEEEVLNDFLNSFEKRSTGSGNNKKGDGMITLDEFLEYYANISASVDDDDYFELMIRNAWHISGGKGWAANTTNKRILVTDVHGNQTVQELKDDIRLKKDDANAMLTNLKSQGIENIAYINTTDKLNMKNTIQNPNIVEIRTKYANNNVNDNGSNAAPSPMPLNAFTLTNPNIPYLTETANPTSGLPLSAYAKQNLVNQRNARNNPPTSAPAAGVHSTPRSQMSNTNNNNNISQGNYNNQNMNSNYASGGDKNYNNNNNIKAKTMNDVPSLNLLRGSSNVNNNNSNSNNNPYGRSQQLPFSVGGSANNSRPSSSRGGGAGLNRTMIY